MPCGLAVGEAERVDVRRQAGLRLRDAVLGVDLVGVAVGADVEGDAQGDRAVAGVDRLHVEHVLDAVHLLLERRRHRLLDGDRVGAREAALDLDQGRDDVRILGDRQPHHRHQAEEHREDRDDDGDDRTIDEEASHGVTSLPARERTARRRSRLRPLPPAPPAAGPRRPP